MTSKKKVAVTALGAGALAGLLYFGQHSKKQQPQVLYTITNCATVSGGEDTTPGNNTSCDETNIISSKPAGK